MIKFCVLGSGSRGNSVFVQVDTTCILIDAGFSRKNLDKKLFLIGKSLSDISHFAFTHAHKDHIPAWFMKSDLAGKRVSLDQPSPYPWLSWFECNHDEPCHGYTISHCGNKLVIIMDTGTVTETMLKEMIEVDAIMIESNYDVDLLVEGKYSTDMQERIAAENGHLRNECAADAIAAVNWPGLEYVVALHLSGNNNNPALVRQGLEHASPGSTVIIAEQDTATKMVTML